MYDIFKVSKQRVSMMVDRREEEMGNNCSMSRVTGFQDELRVCVIIA